MYSYVLWHIFMQVGNLANIYHFTLVESTQHDLSKRAIYSLSVVGEKSEKTAALLEEENVHKEPYMIIICLLLQD